MPRSRVAYPPEFRQKMIELVRSGRNPEALAKEFEPTAQTIRNWGALASQLNGKALNAPASALPPIAINDALRDPPSSGSPQRGQSSGWTHTLHTSRP